MSSHVCIAIAVAVLLGACGGGGGGGGIDVALDATFEDGLVASRYLDGDYSAFRIFGYVYTYDSVGAKWDYYSVYLDAISLTLSGQGISGEGDVAEIYDSVSDTTFSVAGDTLAGFTIAETLTITGYIDGTTLYLRCESASGAALRLILAPYAAEVIDWTVDGLLKVVDDLYGVSDTASTETHSTSGAYLRDLTWMAAPTSTPSVGPIGFGNGSSIYADGLWEGDGTTGLTAYDATTNSFSLEDIDYDISVAFLGESITGTATLTSTGTLADVEGYMVGDTFTVTGTILGATVFLEFEDALGNAFFRHVVSPYDLEIDPQEAPGAITTTYSEYGVTFSTETHFGGEHDIQLKKM